MIDAWILHGHPQLNYAHLPVSLFEKSSASAELYLSTEGVLVDSGINARARDMPSAKAPGSLNMLGSILFNLSVTALTRSIP